METPEEHPNCNKSGCTDKATLVMSFATYDTPTGEGEWMTISVCKTHLMTASSIIDMIVQADLGLVDLNGDPSST